MLRPRVTRVFRLALRRPALVEDEVDEELRLHIALRVEQLVAQGLSPDDAEREARQRFGDSWNEAVQTLHALGQEREERLAMQERFGALWHDLRFAVRALMRSPRFLVAAVLSLGLGIGASTMIFSLVDHIVLRPLPFASPGELVVVREVVPKLSSVYPSMPANASHFLEWQRGCTVCADMAAIKRWYSTLITDGDPKRLGAARVSPNLFTLLGIRPALGRSFHDEEAQGEGIDVVMLSDNVWRNDFGADSTLVGKSIKLGSRSYEVVGILPPGVELPGGQQLGNLVNLAQHVDVYLPLVLSENDRKTTGAFDYAVVARLKAGATASQAEQQLNAVQQRFAATYDDGTSKLRTLVVPLKAQVIGTAGRPLLLLLGAVATVLLIVCVNMANLSLARSLSRQREAAVRIALGAGVGRIVRFALTESLLVALAGGIAGVLFANWGLRVLVNMAPASMPRIGEVTLDARVFAVATLLTLIVGIVVGLLPALRVSHLDPATVLQSGGRTMAGSRSATRRRSAFIVVQVAFSAFLLVATGLFLSSFLRVLRVDPGIDVAHAVAVDVSLPLTTYKSDEDRMAFYDRVIREVAAIPGVSAAAVTSALPLEGETWVDDVYRADDNGGGNHPSANYRFVSPDYFSAIGTPFRKGRTFDESDRAKPGVIISERTARTLWPDGDAIGKRVNTGSRGVAEVVGIVADVRTSSLESEGSLVVYQPLLQDAPVQAVVVARTRGSADARMVSEVRSVLRRMDASITVPRMRTLSQVLATTLAARRFQLVLLLLFACLALTTASIGIYGVISQSVLGRTNEIGVRMALGAKAGDIHRLVLREGLIPVATGLLVGIIVSVAVGRVVANLLFEVKPTDMQTLASVTMLLGIVGLLACLIPARRATRTQLSEMLRSY